MIIIHFTSQQHELYSNLGITKEKKKEKRKKEKDDEEERKTKNQTGKRKKKKKKREDFNKFLTNTYISASRHSVCN